jgi:hypothetical protein
MNSVRSALLTLALAGLALEGLPTTSRAATVGFGTYDLTQSNAFGTGSFGTVKISDLGGGNAEVKVDVSPNYILDVGATHWAGAFTLAGGSVDASSISSPHLTLAPGNSFQNSPFKFFTSAIEADCTKGNCGPTLGATYSFHILNFAGLKTASDLFNGLAIVFALDIYRSGCTGYGCTGVVGAVIGGGDHNQDQSPVPLPPALILFGSALVGLAALGRRRRMAYTR